MTGSTRDTEMSSDPTLAKRYGEMHRHIDLFIDQVLGTDKLISSEDYVPGNQSLQLRNLVSADDFPGDLDDLDGDDYLEGLIRRFESDRGQSVLFCVGALGSGKSTAIRQLRHLIQKEQRQLASTYVDCMMFKTETFSVIDFVREVANEIIKSIADHVAPGDSFPSIRYMIPIESARQLALRERWSFPPIGTDASKRIAEHAFDPCLERPPNWEERARAMDAMLDVLKDAEDALFQNEKLAIATTGCLLSLLAVTAHKIPLLLIDNLDQLATEKIGAAVQTIYSLSLSCTSSSRFMVALRPNSFSGIRGYTKNMQYVFHQGPCCFEMMRERLVKYVLSRSIAELKVQGVFRPHEKEASRTEICAFIICCWMYALIMQFGMLERSAGTRDLQVAVNEMIGRLHPEQAALLSELLLPLPSLAGVSRTVDAVVGLSGRYAVVHLSRFFSEFYLTHTRHLADYVDVVLRRNFVRRVSVQYRVFVEAVLFKKRSIAPLGKCANIFRPVFWGGGRRKPTLVTLRILSELRASGSRGRLEVISLAALLSKYGVALPLIRDTLNAMHDERRRLVWFDHGHEILEGDDPHARITISEVGIGYHVAVVRDFDYLWTCAAEIQGWEPAQTTFRSRLEKYASFMSDLLEVELKQLAFSRLAADAIPNQILGPRERLLTFEILVNSLPPAVDRAVSALQNVASRNDHADRADALEYSQEIIQRVREICNLITRCRKSYSDFFGTDDLINLYPREVSEADIALKRFAENISDSYVRAIVDASMAKTATSGSSSAPQHLHRDVVSSTAGFVSGFVPKQVKDSVDSVARISVYLSAVNESMQYMKDLLKRGLPTFQEICVGIDGILSRVEGLLDTAKSEGIAASESVFKQAFSLETKMKSAREKLRLNEYKVEPPPTSWSEADERWKRHANVFTVVVDLITEVCGSDDSRLELYRHQLACARSSS